LQMKMNKVRVRHGDNLASRRRDTKTQSFEKINEACGPCG
jgi:hypothetical protein